MHVMLARACSVQLSPTICLPERVCKLRERIASQYNAACVSIKPQVQVFMGRLRESENERVSERMWHGMIEIVISWSMFGQTMDAAFLVYMAALGILKAFHWLIQDRINFMQTEPHITSLQHARTVSCLLLLLVSRLHQS
jgi:hypothetical protein